MSERTAQGRARRATAEPVSYNGALVGEEAQKKETKKVAMMMMSKSDGGNNSKKKNWCFGRAIAILRFLSFRLNVEKETPSSFFF